MKKIKVTDVIPANLAVRSEIFGGDIGDEFHVRLRAAAHIG